MKVYKHLLVLFFLVFCSSSFLVYPENIDPTNLDGKVFYLVNKWRCDSGDNRCNMVLSFDGTNVNIVSKDDKSNWVPWLFKKVDGKTDQYYLFNLWHCICGESRCKMVLSFDGTNVNIVSKDDTNNWVPWQLKRVDGTQDQFYLDNRWGCDRGEHRCGMVLSFGGTNVVLWSKNDFNNWVPWQLVPACSCADRNL